MSTADKLLAILPLFTKQRPDWTVDQAADALDVSGSTAYRYFSSLAKAGLLEPTTSGRYILGPAIIAFDRQIRIQDPLLQISDPILKRLVARNEGRGVALLCRRFREQVMCVHQVYERKLDYAVSYERGRPMGLYRGAASLVVLANLPARAVAGLWSTDADAMTAAGLGATLDEVRKCLRSVRAAGSTVTHGQLDKGMIGIAAPIRHGNGRVMGSVGFVLPEQSLSEEEIAGARTLIEAAAREIDVAVKDLDGREGAS